MLALPHVVGLEVGEEALANGRRGVVVLVHKVHQVLRRVVLLPQVRLERAHQPRGRVPGVGVGPALLGLPQVLVIREQVRQRGRHGRVQARVARDVQRRRGRDVDGHVLLAHAAGRGRDPVDDQPAVVVVRHLHVRARRLGLRPALALGGGVVPAGRPRLLLGAHLGVPAKRPGRQDLRHLVPLAQPPGPPRHEAVRVHGPDRRLAEREVVVVQEALELGRDLRALDPAEDPLRQAGRLDDLEALQDRRLGRHQLQQQALRLLDVPQSALLPRPVHAMVQERCTLHGGR